jgi:hypothetical protein
LHDACCPDWPGVALAIDTLQQENATFEKVVLPLYPGLCILQKTRPVVIIRPINSDENDQVNEWRRQAGITMRPLPHGDDPRPAQSSTDSRVGLFAIVCDGKLAGGFGIRPRTFRQAAEDDFLPADGLPCSGFLVYGVVLRPEVRGQGVYDFVQQELLRWFGAAGFYAITDYPGELQSMASIQNVGQSGPYRAYHIRPLYTAAKTTFSLARQIEYRLRNMRTIRQITQEVVDLQQAAAEREHSSRQEIANLQQALAGREHSSRQEIANLQHVLAEREQATLAKEGARCQEIANLQHELKSLQQSRSWRWTRPMRRVISFLRQASSSGATTGHARVGGQPQDSQGTRSHPAG